jgi:hypothetical protein
MDNHVIYFNSFRGSNDDVALLKSLFREVADLHALFLCQNLVRCRAALRRRPL